MTQRMDNVEPPLASRRVQITLALLVATIATCSYFWQVSPADRSDAAVDFDRTALIEIDVNVAEPRELALLPGVGPTLAKRIAENRDRLGPFTSIEDVGRVHGIGPKTLKQIGVFCVVGPTLAAANRSERLASARDSEEPAGQGSFDPDGR